MSEEAEIASAEGAEQKAGWALFDLDHTILPFDTQVFFANYVLRREGWRRIYLLWFLPVAALAVFKVVSLKTAKRFFTGYLWGMSRDRLRQYVDDFLEEDFSAACYPDVVACLQQHQEEGHTTILNTASPSFYAEAISRFLCFDHCVSTRLVASDPMPWLPEVSGPNNKHEAKIPAMKRYLPEDYDPSGGQKLPNSTAYSDSAADIPLLSVCEKGVMIHPKEEYAAVGSERGWSTMLPDRPYSSSLGSKLATLRQMLGLYTLPEDSGVGIDVES